MIKTTMAIVRQYDEAWLHYDQANKLKRTHPQSIFSETETGPSRGSTNVRPIHETLRVFSRSYFANREDFGSSSDPMDVLVSCYCQNLNAPFCDLEQLVHYHRNYRQMMKHWERVLPMKIHTVDYESLVADPEQESRRLIEHCGLAWDDNCLSFHTSNRAVHTPSKWQVRQPMYSTSLQKWRRFEKQLASIATKIEADLRDEQWMATLC